MTGRENQQKPSGKKKEKKICVSLAPKDQKGLVYGEVSQGILHSENNGKRSVSGAHPGYFQSCGQTIWYFLAVLVDGQILMGGSLDYRAWLFLVKWETAPPYREDAGAD